MYRRGPAVWVAGTARTAKMLRAGGLVTGKGHGGNPGEDSNRPDGSPEYPSIGIGTQTARRVAPICTSFAKEGVALRLRSGSARWRGQRETPNGRDVMAMVECEPPSNA